MRVIGYYGGRFARFRGLCTVIMERNNLLQKYLRAANPTAAGPQLDEDPARDDRPLHDDQQPGLDPGEQQAGQATALDDDRAAHAEEAGQQQPANDTTRQQKNKRPETARRFDGHTYNFDKKLQSGKL